MPTKELTVEQQAKMTSIVALMGKLLVARKDVKAIETKLANGYGWVPDRERVPRGGDPLDGALIPMRMQDFTDHMIGKRCMGTYLLDADSCTKFVAFDIDLKKMGRFYPVRTIEELGVATAGMSPGQAEAFLESEVKMGDLESALHRPDLPAHRWGRIMLDLTALTVVSKVNEVLGLPTLMVLTGGGMHVLVPFGQLVPAADARRMGREVMDACGYAATKGDNFFAPGNDPECGVEVEVFPKQDTNQGFGNLIRLPLGWHAGVQRRTTFVNVTVREGLLPWDIPKADPLAEMERVAAMLGIA